MGNPESDERVLLEGGPKDLAIDVDENPPPPYQRHQRGQKVYPTNRAYNWFCERRGTPYPHHEDARDTRQQRRTGCAVIFLAIPVVLLMSLGIYLLTTMVFWCPTCRHLSKGQAVYHVAPETQIKSPKERLDANKVMDSPPIVPEAQRPLNQVEKRQSVGEEVPEQPHFIRRVFFFFHPKQENEQEQEKAEEKQPLLDTTGNRASEQPEIPPPFMGGLPARMMQTIVGTAENIFSNLCNFFTLHRPGREEKKPEQNPAEESGEKREKAKKSTKVEENGKELANLDYLIDETVKEHIKTQEKEEKHLKIRADDVSEKKSS